MTVHRAPGTGPAVGGRPYRLLRPGGATTGHAAGAEVVAVLVDCDSCEVRGRACADCVVTVLLGMPAPASPVELDDADRDALGVLAGAGLVPPLRLVSGAYDAPRGSRGARAG